MSKCQTSRSVAPLAILAVVLGCWRGYSRMELADACWACRDMFLMRRTYLYDSVDDAPRTSACVSMSPKIPMHEQIGSECANGSWLLETTNIGQSAWQDRPLALENESTCHLTRACHPNLFRCHSWRICTAHFQIRGVPSLSQR